MSTTSAKTSPGGQRTRRLAILGAASVAVAIGVVFAVIRFSGGESVPYQDPAAAGRLTLCGANGKAVTEGPTDAPLAAIVLGSSTPPKQFLVPGAVGSLFAYQPRPGVEAQEFSGLQLTGSSVLAHPAEQTGVQVTKDATTLSQFVVAFPANLKGFVQLRLYISAPGAGTLNSTYDTADVRVSGNHWTLVRGGSADCSKASSALVPSSTS